MWLCELNRTVRNGYSYITLPFPNDLQYVRHDKNRKQQNVYVVYNDKVYEVEIKVWSRNMWKIMKNFENVDSSMKKNKKSKYVVM